MLLLCIHTTAQDSRAEQIFKEVRAAYNSYEYLSYNVDYCYAKEKTPADYIDTVTGSYKVHGNDYWGMLDSVEYMQNEKFFVAVYPEEKIIMLNSTSPAWQQANNNWDSIWLKQKHRVNTIAAEQEGRLVLTFNFYSDTVYKRIELQYNSKTKLMEKIVYVMREPAGAAGPDDEDNEQTGGNKQDEFVVMEVRFSQYSTAPFDRGLLDETRYVLKNDKEYVPAKKYQDYTILIGSPNLIN